MNRVLGMGRIRYTLYAFCGLLLFGCQKEIVPELYLPRDDHQSYLSSLKEIGLLETALGKDWSSASEIAVTNALYVETPYHEDFYLNPSEPSAIGYRFWARKGNKVNIQVYYQSMDTTQLFLDVFRIGDDDHDDYPHVASSDQKRLLLEFEPKEDRQYIFRIQPELLRGGNFRLEIKMEPALHFPVVGKNNENIGSLFGAPRDGGRRRHHGVDIFAPKHTPIIAPTDGRIRWVGERGLGGNVIWMRDLKRKQTLYFAHLQDIMVDDGQLVSTGDTIGTVGNTGNARTTPPHLHFGIYQSGPIDPYHYIAEINNNSDKIRTNQDWIGKTMRSNSKTKLKIQGNQRTSETIDLPKNSIMQGLGANSNYYRVQLPDKTIGFVHYSNVEIAAKPVMQTSSDQFQKLYVSPTDTTIHSDHVKEGELVNIIGDFTGFQMVEKKNGNTGWIKRI